MNHQHCPQATEEAYTVFKKKFSKDSIKSISDIHVYIHSFLSNKAEETSLVFV